MQFTIKIERMTSAQWFEVGFLSTCIVLGATCSVALYILNGNV